MNGKKLVFLLPIFALLVGCQDPTGNVCFRFSFSVDGSALAQDTMAYQNAAGNIYEITEVQYFISDVVITRDDGQQIAILSDRGAHYVDADIPATLSWAPGDEIPAGNYTQVSFVMGLAPALNQPYFYPNPPENNMSWPLNMGGGYHHIKINGRWMASSGTITPFNMHIGTGQWYDDNGEISSFVDNAVKIVLPLENFTIDKKGVQSMHVEMQIDHWFDTPNVFNWDEIGGSIMQNQNAQELLKANAWNVFCIY
ncbi:MAG: hypothetical protein MJZ57_03430 [Bacteroidales bacterium]|nr:hypothetical protein [Bacteroidales bacterium]